jgi:hypothetical protein
MPPFGRFSADFLYLSCGRVIFFRKADFMLIDLVSKDSIKKYASNMNWLINNEMDKPIPGEVLKKVFDAEDSEDDHT